LAKFGANPGLKIPELAAKAIIATLVYTNGIRPI